MKRIFLVCPLVALTLFSSASHAQRPPEVLDHFRLIPRLSTLHSTGQEGPDQHYRLMGEYDFRQRFAEPREAQFENAEIWGSIISDLPTPAIVTDIDELLNLDGLKSERLRVPAPFHVYRFTGDTSDGSSVNLLAAVLGNWMYVRGATEPPPISDFPTHRFRWLARSRPFADPSGDGTVDAADYVLIRNAETSGIGVGSELDGTAGVTFADWRQQFGETLPDVTAVDAVLSAAAASDLTPAAVPEPSSTVTAIVACLMLVHWRRPAR